MNDDTAKARIIFSGIFLLVLYFCIDQVFFTQLITKPLTIQKKNGELLHYTVEVTSTLTQSERGLMYRLHMRGDHGMIFSFDPPIKAKFWMKNTFIPLDIIFIDADNKITDIAHAKRLDETPVGPDSLTAKVVELNAKQAEENNIQIGDTVR